MKKIRLIALLITCFLLLPGCGQKATDVADQGHSFFQFVGKTDWQVNLPDFAVSLEEKENVFELRVSGRYLRFSAYRKNDGDSGRFGPLQARYAPELAGLLKYALLFAEQEKDGDFGLGLDWGLYPESILKWAQTWRDSDLRINWDAMDPHARYGKLTEMISERIREDTQETSQVLGFEAVGASMEKMSFQKAGRLGFYRQVLEPAGIPPELELPIPMMTSVRLKPAGDAAAQRNISPVTGPFAVDYVFAVAQSQPATLYCSFQRVLDEYEISGDIKKSDGTYESVLPMDRNAYRPMAVQLLKACLKGTGGDQRQSFSLRLNLGLYPDLYRQAVRHFSQAPDEARDAVVKRSDLPHLLFYSYRPSPDSGFEEAVNPFLEQIGYRFRNFQISIDSRPKAAGHPEYEDKFRPLGIEPEENLAVPDIVYMVVEKL
jgi:hypothetical protein